jgi:isocitrate lyase
MGLILADAGTDHGGITAVMKLTKMLIEQGKRSIVISVQLKIHLPSTKKCGHRVDNVLMPISKHMSHLVALCAQYDIMGVENIVICSY